ncbi:hypothetical protein bcere0017_20380 [Bacillus cereus Rock1-3]|nr:hypothetical protein bcere0017_20380 [Bacillus cereus Rock1-3]
MYDQNIEKNGGGVVTIYLYKNKLINKTLWKKRRNYRS